MLRKLREDFEKDIPFFRWMVTGTLKVAAVVIALGALEGLIEFYI